MNPKTERALDKVLAEHFPKFDRERLAVRSRASLLLTIKDAVAFYLHFEEALSPAAIAEVLGYDQPRSARVAIMRHVRGTDHVLSKSHAARKARERRKHMDEVRRRALP